METIIFNKENESENINDEFKHPSVSEYLTDYISPSDLAEIFSGAVESLTAFAHIANNSDEVKHQASVLAVFTEILKSEECS